MVTVIHSIGSYTDNVSHNNNNNNNPRCLNYISYFIHFADYIVVLFLDSITMLLYHLNQVSEGYISYLFTKKNQKIILTFT